MSTDPDRADVVRLVTTDGVRDIEVTDSDARSLAGKHLSAVGFYLANGTDESVDRLTAFQGARIADLELETDPDVIDALDDSGELDVGELYPSRRADWR